MRLLNTCLSDAGDFVIQEFFDYELPPYAILSHTWGEEEVTYQEINAVSAKEKSGYKKIIQCCSVARADGYKYVWIDTCCIDKTSSAELSEAINSMYRWYQKSELCYAILADVQSDDEIDKSRWLTRGWTLQELIAPSKVVFLNKRWESLGDKATLQDRLSEYTGIPAGILSGDEDIETSSIAQRMSWAAERQTRRVEDRAYSLMGIFNVNMPLIYGEGENAFIRLQEEIMRISDDQSLFAWVSSDDCSGLLAISPAAFAHSHNIVRSNLFGRLDSPFTVDSRGVHLDIGFAGISGDGLGLAILNCTERTRTEETQQDKVIAIYLKDLTLTMSQFKRVHSGSFRHIDLEAFRPIQYPVRRICVRGGRTMLIRQRIAAKQDDISPQSIHLYDEVKLPTQYIDPAALLVATEAGNLGGVWLLLTRSNIGIHETNLNENGQEGIVHILLEKGAYIETRNSDAAANGHERAAIEITRSDRHTPLSLAAENGQEGIVHMLFERSAFIETRNSDATANGHERAAIETKNSDTAANGHGRAAIEPDNPNAAENGHEDIVQILLERGAAIETKNSDAAANGHGPAIEPDNQNSQTPLSLAAENGHEDVVQMLLERGAAVETKGQWGGKTPLALAAAKGYGGIIPLFKAIQNGHEDIANLLSETGAKSRTRLFMLRRTPL
ncbi:ankyrin repeat-containing protein [Aspergillus eucalypticola CBS 122712]|uniref:Ankyrin repeat-containing protein n=1 Tax=Aspergillus eucalypticola (strain CBS 122712 / IBT 29274) TaxID=1448314 RepID=A0A317V0I9_ASPEC|nr:ankyrin repeat-containing protein [Aspergillus eucalypticola CBS 122712]PWY66891.1 ankyrin repeat-containing protein [Aspergillus eucalypticola CBS 122712]